MDKKEKAAGVIAGLNVFDAAMTILWIQAGLAIEANPFMSLFLGISPVLFMIVKLGLVQGSLWFLSQTNKPIASVGLAITGVCYVVLGTWHVYGIVLAL